MRLVTICLALMSLATAHSAFAKAPIPVAGNYVCYTYQVSLQNRDRIRTSVATLETDWRQVLERQTDIYPAGISIVLDGKNGYRVAGTRAKGTYSYSNSSGQVSFAGEAAELKLRSYFVKNGLYIMQFQPNADVFYHCEFNSGNRSTGATANGQSSGKGAGQSTQTLVAFPPRSTTPITASDVSGRFVGNYACGQGKTSMRLDIQANPNGRLTATFSFGGENGIPSGSFSMRGLWSADSFFLSADQWINQPEGYSMTNLNGYLSSKGRLGGEVLATGCSAFDVTRK